MLTFILAFCMTLIIGTLGYHAYSTYKPIVDRERAIQSIEKALEQACEEMSQVLVQKNEPSKAEYEGMLLPYPDMK